MLSTGNHDMESNAVLSRTLRELRALGIRVLRNEAVVFSEMARGTGAADLLRLCVARRQDARARDAARVGGECVSRRVREAAPCAAA